MYIVSVEVTNSIGTTTASTSFSYCKTESDSSIYIQFFINNNYMSMLDTGYFAVSIKVCIILYRVLKLQIIVALKKLIVNIIHHV